MINARVAQERSIKNAVWLTSPKAEQLKYKRHNYLSDNMIKILIDKCSFCLVFNGFVRARAVNDKGYCVSPKLCEQGLVDESEGEAHS